MEPEEYSELIADLAPERRTVTVGLQEAAGRIIAEDILAAHPIPEFPTSAMDGFALDPAALASAHRAEEVQVCGDIPAGHPPVPLVSGCAVRVMTGAQVPTGAEAVVPVEATDADRTGPAPTTIRLPGLPETVPPSWNIKAVGEDTRTGETVISTGQRLTAAGVGTLAMLGRCEVPIAGPPRVAVIVTGDELRPLGESSGGSLAECTEGSQAPVIHNSNLPMIASALDSVGAVPVGLTCEDDPAQLLSLLTELQETVDLVITTGGISAGAFEVVRQALEGEHSTLQRLRMRPGAPQGHGRFGSLPMLHFPGTPQGAFLAFHLFAASLLEGRTLSRRWKKAVFAGPEVFGHEKAVTFLPGSFTAAGEVTAGPRARLRDFSGADVILRIPRGPAVVERGACVNVLEC